MKRSDPNGEGEGSKATRMVRVREAKQPNGESEGSEATEWREWRKRSDRMARVIEGSEEKKRRGGGGGQIVKLPGKHPVKGARAELK
jgi:hypothetical protein